MDASIGPYQVIGTLAEGGMGGTYLAEDSAGGVVVLKRQHHAREDVRLRDEARTGMRLSHPNIVETLALIEHRDRPVLVLRYVPGVSLVDIRQQGPSAPAIIARVGRQIAQALAAIHTAVDDHGMPLGVLHRDVTPANILVGYDGDARLIDLGIARSSEARAERTSEGMLRGTMRYIAPEIFAGEAHTTRSDIWALGVVLWEMALGRRAVEGDMAKVLGCILQGRIMHHDETVVVDPIIERLITMALQLDPRRRPSTAIVYAKMWEEAEKAFGESREPTCALAQRISAPPTDKNAPDTPSQRQQFVAAAASAFEHQSVDASQEFDASSHNRDQWAQAAKTVISDGRPWEELPPTVIADGVGFGARVQKTLPSTTIAPRPVEFDPWAVAPSSEWIEEE